MSLWQVTFLPTTQFYLSPTSENFRIINTESVVSLKRNTEYTSNINPQLLLKNWPACHLKIPAIIKTPTLCLTGANLTPCWHQLFFFPRSSLCFDVYYSAASNHRYTICQSNFKNVGGSMVVYRTHHFFQRVQTELCQSRSVHQIAAAGSRLKNQPCCLASMFFTISEEDNILIICKQVKRGFKEERKSLTWAMKYQIIHFCSPSLSLSYIQLWKNYRL